MDKTKEIMFDNLNHKIDINERKNIYLTGIKKLNSFDDKEFFVDSIMGSILIKLDTFQGSLSIKGTIDSINYLDDLKKNSKESIISRLFKWLDLKLKFCLSYFLLYME